MNLEIKDECRQSIFLVHTEVLKIFIHGLHILPNEWQKGYIPICPVCKSSGDTFRNFYELNSFIPTFSALMLQKI